jgi:acyl dehydratase
MLEQPIRFSEEDIELFSAVSGDRNPLHVSREYASQTPYGHRVVFGALGAVACLGRMPLPGGWTIRRLRAEFLRPMFLNVDYRMRIVEQRGEWIGRLYDGSLPTLSLTVEAAVAATQSTRRPPARRGSSEARRLSGRMPELCRASKHRRGTPAIPLPYALSGAAGARPGIRLSWRRCAAVATWLGWTCRDGPPSSPS